jgi:hypothetical protein
MSRSLRRTALGLVAVGTLCASPASAQQSSKARVTLERIRTAWCMDFLAEPVQLADLMAKGWKGAPASTVKDLASPFRITLEEDQRYASWVPARVCLVAFGAMSLNGDESQDDSERKPMAMAWFQVSAHPDTGTAVTDIMLMLASNSYKVRNPFGRVFLSFEDLGFEMGPNAKQDPSQNGFQVKLAGATLFWKGYLTPDSTVGPGRRVIQANVGNQSHPWAAAGWLETSGASRVAGVVGVMGKSDLGKLLDRSPIRVMSAVATDGTGELSFDRLD